MQFLGRVQALPSHVKTPPVLKADKETKIISTLICFIRQSIYLSLPLAWQPRNLAILAPLHPLPKLRWQHAQQLGK